MKIIILFILLIGCIIATTDARTRFARQAQQSVLDCIRQCPTATSEYNPVCGDNGVTYDNPSKLACAQNSCNVNVSMRRRGNCSSFN